MKLRCIRLFAAWQAVSIALLSAGMEPSVRADGEEEVTQAESSEDTLTMSFDGASLKDVLLLFSQKTGMNFVASQEIEQTKITVYFENVSPKEALDAIMETNKLAYTRNAGSSIYMVYPKRNEVTKLVTKIFRLKYARLSSSPLDVGGQQTVSDLKTMANAGSSSSSEGSSSGSSVSSGRGIDSVIRSFLSSQGKMALDISSNSIIVTDIQEALDRIQGVLAELDLPQPQVVLEVHVMEVQKGLVSDKGISWGGTDGAIFEYGAGARTTTFPFREKLFDQNETVPTVESGEGPSSLFEGQTGLDPQMSFGILDASNFQAVLHFIQSDSKTKILARPRILTQNNEAAVIRLVTNTSIANQTVTDSSNGATTSTTNEAERSETGVTLRMTPQINTDNSVMLFLEPSVTTVGASVFFPTTFLDPTTRVVRTMARVQDNQTLVIGGLIDSTASYAKRKVPYLSDIPGIGALFSYDAVDDQNRELVVFITPHIVRGNNSLTQQNVTAAGRDILAKKLLDEFTDAEADIHLGAFEPERQNSAQVDKARARREKALTDRAELKASDPSVEKQMSMALDAFSPQLLDDEITKALSFQSGTRSQSG